MINIPPAFIYIIGVLFIPFLKGKVKQAWLLLIPVIAFVEVLSMSHGNSFTVSFLDQELIFGRVDRLSLVFSYVFIIASFISILYAMQVKEDGHHIASFFYVGGALGVTFAGDLITLFIFWELLAVASVFLVWYRRKKSAIKAGFRYIMFHTFGGLCLLGGIVLHVANTGSIEFTLMQGGGLAFYLILTGFIVNAAVPPLGAWLPDAYPEATVQGAVFMSAFTTKSAVYVLLRAYPGTEILVWLGVFMALYGVVYAVLANDIRRLLAYHIISQVGYMVAGVGIGTAMAINGVVAHAFAHILYKGLLFMGAGSVLYMTGKDKLTQLGGIYKTMPITMVLYMIGGLSISAFPLFSGFVSKSMIISAAAEDHRLIIMLGLTFASAGTFLHTGLKLPWFTFFGKDSGIRAKEPPMNMLIAMGIGAFLCIFIGVFPQSLYYILPNPVDFHPYTVSHVVWTLEILLFTGLGFFMLLNIAGGKEVISVDTDWFYRKGIKGFLWFAHKQVRPANDFVDNADETVVTRQTLNLANGCRRFDLEVVDAIVNGVAWLTRVVSWLSHQIDIYIVDGLINSVATLVGLNSSFWRKLQTGLLPNYGLIMLGGLVFVLGILLLGGLLVFI